MEVQFNNILDNIIYRANIFNYDNTFLKEVISRNIKLDFNDFANGRKQKLHDITTTVNFLKLKSKEQILQLVTLCNHKDEESGDAMAEVEATRKFINTKDAKISLLMLLELIIFSKQNFDNVEGKRLYQRDQMEVEELKRSELMKGVHWENLLACLLYIDGLGMINIETLRKLSEISPLLGVSFTELLFDLLNDKFLDPFSKEIASHILSIDLMNYEVTPMNKCLDIMTWTWRHYIENKRENCLTSNLCLILTHDNCSEIFINQFEEEKKCVQELFNLMIKENNFNTIYESLFVFWNISNNPSTTDFFDNKKEKYLEKIVQVIKTNKIDKIARIGLMTIKNLLQSQTCMEILFDIKFMRTIDILLTNKWNDNQIRELLNFIYDFLEKNYKIMNSFDKYIKELESGNLKPGSLHTTQFWEDNYKDFEYNNFEYIRQLVRILDNPNIEHDIEMKCIACFDLGEFARLYPGGASILEFFGAKDALLFLIQHNNLELKNRALVCLQKIMMRSLKK